MSLHRLLFQNHIYRDLFVLRGRLSHFGFDKCGLDEVRLTAAIGLGGRKSPLFAFEFLLLMQHCSNFRFCSPFSFAVLFFPFALVIFVCLFVFFRCIFRILPIARARVINRFLWQTRCVVVLFRNRWQAIYVAHIQLIYYLAR